MSDCTNVGESGTGISLGSYGAAGPMIPVGVKCNLVGYSQSALDQYAFVTNTDGTVVAKIYATGNAGGPVAMTPPTGFSSNFVSDGRPYTMTIGNTGPQSSVVIGNRNTVPPGVPAPNAAYWIFISEDTPQGGDCDFNDSTVMLFWNVNT